MTNNSLASHHLMKTRCARATALTTPAIKTGRDNNELKAANDLSAKGYRTVIAGVLAYSSMTISDNARRSNFQCKALQRCCPVCLHLWRNFCVEAKDDLALIVETLSVLKLKFGC
jgi:hypothetical protein